MMSGSEKFQSWQQCWPFKHPPPAIAAYTKYFLMTMRRGKHQDDTPRGLGAKSWHHWKQAQLPCELTCPRCALRGKST